MCKLDSKNMSRNNENPIPQSQAYCPIEIYPIIVDGNRYGLDVSPQDAKSPPKLTSPIIVSDITPSNTSYIQKYDPTYPICNLAGQPLGFDGKPIILESTKQVPKLPIASITAESLPQESLPLSIIPAQTDTIETSGESKNVSRKKPTALAREILYAVPIRIVGEVMYAFTGTHFEPLSKSNTKRLLHKIAREEIFNQGTPQLLNELYELIYHEPDICLPNLNQPMNFVSFKNGLLNLQTGVFSSHSPQTFLTWSLNVDWEPNPVTSMNCPHFEQFLQSCAGGDPVLIQRIWQCLGLILTGDVSPKKIILFQGVSNSGKSKLAEFITSLLNESSVMELRVSEMSRQFALADVIGKHLITSMDLPDAALDAHAVSFLKMLSSGGSDLISTDVKYQARAKFKSFAHCLFGTNHALHLIQEDEALLERLVVVPFNCAIPPEQRNPNLLDLFECERSSIVRKALKSYQELKLNSFRFAGDGDYVINGNIHTKADSNIGFLVTPNLDTLIQEFAVSHLVFGPVDKCSAFSCDLFAAYKSYEDSLSIPLSCDVRQFSSRFHSLFKEMIVKAKWRRSSTSKSPENGYKGVSIKQ